MLYYIYIYIIIYISLSLSLYIYIYIHILRRYEQLAHLSPVVVKSVCGGYLACGLSAGLWRVVSNPPFPLRHLSC